MRFPVEVVEADLLDPPSLRKAIAGCDAIIHLGAGEKAGRETQAIAETALEAGIKRFVHLSSACVYGLGLPSRIEKLQEDTRVIKTGELYADGKAQAEFAVLRAVKNGLPAVMLRPQVVYGPGMRWSVELMQLLAQGEICVLEDGGWANLIYIDDLVAAISRALDSEISGGRAFFITDGSPVRWSEYLFSHAQLLGADPVRVNRRDVLPNNNGFVALVKESFLPLLPVLRTPEFRSFVLQSPLMQATVFRGYLALRERPAVRSKLNMLRNGAPGKTTGFPGNWNEHWIKLQLSESCLSSERAEKELGFKAKVNFAAGLRRSLGWFQQYGLVTSITDATPSVPEEADLAAVSN
jgi:nucleoside-diphosphate-sugar epimerase